MQSQQHQAPTHAKSGVRLCTRSGQFKFSIILETPSCTCCPHNRQGESAVLQGAGRDRWVQTPWVQPAQAPLVSPGLFSERLTHTVCLAGAPAPCHLMVILQMSYTSHWREWARPQGTRELQEKTATCPEAPRLGLAYKKRAVSKDVVSALAVEQKG